jgi:hypothetical protein
MQEEHVAPARDAQLRKTFCAVGERSSFHTAWVIRDRVEPAASPAVSAMSRLRPIFAAQEMGSS